MDISGGPPEALNTCSSTKPTARSVAMLASQRGNGVKRCVWTSQAFMPTPKIAKSHSPGASAAKQNPDSPSSRTR